MVCLILFDNVDKSFLSDYYVEKNTAVSFDTTVCKNNFILFVSSFAHLFLILTPLHLIIIDDNIENKNILSYFILKRFSIKLYNLKSPKTNPILTKGLKKYKFDLYFTCVVTKCLLLFSYI